MSASGSPITGPFYFALLTAPVGTTDPTAFTFSGLYATNTGVPGRIQGGSPMGVPVPGWQAGTSRAFMVCGWPASMGCTWNPAGTVARSMIATGMAGGTDPVTGGSIPALPLFSGSTITSFDMTFCLSPGFFGISLEPPSQIVIAGATVFFSVAAIACPDPCFQWYFNGAPIPGGADGSYRIASAQASDAGEYFAVLSNPSWPIWSGTTHTSMVAILTVLTAPVISSQPQSQTAEAGSTVDLSVRASGPQPQGCQWFFNGTAALSTAATDGSLLLTNVQPAQAGAYVVIITNVAGGVTSAPAMLSVIPPVPRSMVPGLVLTGQAGQTLNLEFARAIGPLSSWAPLGSVDLTNTSRWYFDLATPPPQQRFYRASQSGGPAVAPLLDLQLVPALTLTGTIGSSKRVDYINQFGPTDAWVTLATVTLTNTTQLYFDTTAIGEPCRLYRLLPGP